MNLRSAAGTVREWDVEGVLPRPVEARPRLHPPGRRAVPRSGPSPARADQCPGSELVGEHLVLMRPNTAAPYTGSEVVSV